MLRITLQPQWRVSQEDGPALDANPLLGLLAAVQGSGSISQAARSGPVVPPCSWGLLQQAEQLFGQPFKFAGVVAARHSRHWAKNSFGPMRASARACSPCSNPSRRNLKASSGAQRRQRAVPRLHASHGFAVAALREQLAARQVPVELRYRNSLEAVAALAQGDCELAGFHVPLGEFEAAAARRYLTWLKPDQHLLVQPAVRTQGLFVAPGNPLGLRGLGDLTAARAAFRQPAGVAWAHAC